MIAHASLCNSVASLVTSPARHPHHPHHSCCPHHHPHCHHFSPPTSRLSSLWVFSSLWVSRLSSLWVLSLFYVSALRWRRFWSDPSSCGRSAHEFSSLGVPDVLREHPGQLLERVVGSVLCQTTHAGHQDRNHRLFQVLPHRKRLDRRRRAGGRKERTRRGRNRPRKQTMPRRRTKRVDRGVHRRRTVHTRTHMHIRRIHTTPRCISHGLFSPARPGAQSPRWRRRAIGSASALRDE